MENMFLPYTYSDFLRDLHLVERRYGARIEKKQIGRSVNHRPIVLYRVGGGKERIHISGSHHAREWMTSWLVVQLLQHYASMYDNNEVIDGISIREVLDSIAIEFVPMVNPDGVILATEGWKQADLPYEQYLEMADKNRIGERYWLWKANIRGVDLNRQYPMNWEEIRNSPDGPAAMNYKGERPSSEPEVWALQKEIISDPPIMVIAYHSAGEEIYWYHGQEGAEWERDYVLAKSVGQLTGYRLISPEEHVSGGFADWFVSAYRRPGFTIEIGKEPHPVDLRQARAIWSRNKNVPIFIIRQLLHK